MRILHLMLSCFYVDGVAYQENMLPKQNYLDGHVVKIIASTETLENNGKLGYVEPSTYLNEYGCEVIRLPYKRFLPHLFMKKIRAYPGVYQLVEQFDPDVILHHGVPSFELLTLARYKKRNPRVKLFLDSHEDFHNSARSFISREGLHRGFYGPIARKVLPFVDKILCVNLESMDFLQQMYRIPPDKLEFYPLGGTIFEEEERKTRKQRKRLEIGLNDEEILMLHTGKMQDEKKTVELLTAFSKVKDSNFKLFLVGVLGDDIEHVVKPMISNDSRIKYVGWKDVDVLYDYLCASDIYLQPGTQSATMQNALCCGCPVMLYPYKSHKPFLNGNGFFVETVEDMVRVFLAIEKDSSILEEMGKASLRIAFELLDYRRLASRLYQ